MVKGNATVGLNEVNYSRGGCIFWSETSNQGLQVACQGKPRELLLTVLTPDHLHSPGDGGNPVTSACIAFRQKVMRKKSRFRMAYTGQHKARDYTGMNLCPPSAPFELEEAAHAGCLHSSIRGVEPWETQTFLSFCTNCVPDNSEYRRIYFAV